MLPDEDPRHGTLNGYKNFRCRCEPCRAVESRYEKRRKWLVHQGLSPSVPALGFQRRVHALMRIGWTQKSIAEALGIATGNLSLKMRANTLVYRATHLAMCEIYEERCMRPQRGVVNDRTARIAIKRGWASPLAWDDIDADEKPIVVSGDGAWNDRIDAAVVRQLVDGGKRTRQLTRAESDAVVKELLGRGISTHQIEANYGLNTARYATPMEVA